MRPAVSLMILTTAMLMGGGGDAAQDRGSRGNPGRPTAITLSNVHPAGEFALDPQTVAAAPPVLALKVTKVVNPAETGFQLFVYLSYQATSGFQKILVGNVGFYPPDRPAGFLLRSSRAFAELKRSTTKPSDVRLSLEIKRLHESKPWTQVEITVAPPEWKSEPKE